MKEMDDGRYHKVANIIGNTMKYHPHGDASIGDALVQLGQKDLLIDCQGNWGNIYTGDRAAAPRYIEARLTKFALEVLFNPKTTEWQLSYDGRNKEPVTLPVKFPLLLAQGVEGIAVGMACKILPHNFNELIDASIAYLRGRSFKLLPDFPTAGMADFSNYNDGLRGGRVKVRAKIEKVDKTHLRITEIPFGTTTSSLIDSIIKAVNKGKIKVKKIEDNTAEHVEINIYLAPGVSPDKMIDALYAFTDCEVSISPNAAVIFEDKPHFLGVKEMLKIATDNTVKLLKRELEIKLSELQEQWHFASLEKIFIEKKIYVKLHGLGYEEAIELTHDLLKPHIKHLVRAITDDDVKRLLEIRMRRITKHDADQAEEKIAKLEADIEQTKFHLDNLIDYAVDYYKELKRKYGEGRERKTEIRTFDTIDAAKVAVNNVKLMANFKEGFIGFGLKRGEGDVITDCSDIDDIIVFKRDGSMKVVRIADKVFVGKDIIYAGVWKKGDKRTVYNMIYRDGKSGPYRVKRFNVTSITRDKDYDLTKGTKGSEIVYFTANPNGEAEVVNILHRPKPNLRKLKFDFDFSTIDIKGRGAGGNILTKHSVAKIQLKEKGVSTLAPRRIFFDDTVQRLNSDERGTYLGDFKADDKILTIMQSGHYKLTSFDLSTKFDDDMIVIEKWNPNKPVTAIYYDGNKQQFFIKRFLIEDTDKKTLFISDHPDSYLEIVSTDWLPQIQLTFAKVKGQEKDPEVINAAEFIAVKGLKAQGNRLSPDKIKSVDLLEPLPYEEETKEDEELDNSDNENKTDISTEKEEETKTEYSKRKDTDDGKQQMTLF
jgi:topoisomerase-4 subunit A